MGVDHRLEIDVAQRVAVDDDERRVAVEQRQGVAGAPGGSQQARLPGIPHVEPEVRAVADQARDRLGPVVQIEHDVVDLLRA